MHARPGKQQSRATTTTQLLRGGCMSRTAVQPVNGGWHLGDRPAATGSSERVSRGTCLLAVRQPVRKLLIWNGRTREMTSACKSRPPWPCVRARTPETSYCIQPAYLTCVGQKGGMHAPSSYRQSRPMLLHCAIASWSGAGCWWDARLSVRCLLIPSEYDLWPVTLTMI